MKARLRNIVNDNKYLIGSVLFLSVLFFIFYPTKYISIDENQYLANSFRLTTGRMEEDCSRITEYPGLHYSSTGECTSKYNLGSSLLLLPTTVFGESYAFVIVFISFIASAIIFSRIIRILNMNKFLVILYIFYPPFIYFSRTLFSEVFSLLFINLFIYLVLSVREQSTPWKKDLLTGVVVGFGTLIRYTNLLIFVTFLLGYIWHTKDIRKTIRIGLGAIPFGLLIMLINKDLYGSLFASGYTLSGEEVFSLANIGYNLPRYLMLFIAIYPLMLLALPITRLQLKCSFILPFIAMIFLYSMYPFNFFEGKVSDLITSGRVLIPVVPFILLPYIYELKDKISLPVKVITITLLITSTIIITIFHHNFLMNSEVEWMSPKVYFHDSVTKN
jgi:4-amino-4-deoxy-L-arabinose transferase-like glycosyltransferase